MSTVLYAFSLKVSVIITIAISKIYKFNMDIRRRENTDMFSEIMIYVLYLMNAIMIWAFGFNAYNISNFILISLYKYAVIVYIILQLQHNEENIYITIV